MFLILKNMNLPILKGIIRRRILLNYRVDPQVLEKLLPANFRLKRVAGHGIVGICLIRLEQVRPKGLPAFTGMVSENSAHRIAVEWDDLQGNPREGVFVPRRDTSSLFNSLAGGRIFPGVHHRSQFATGDKEGRISIRVTAKDTPGSLVDLLAHETEDFRKNRFFILWRLLRHFLKQGAPAIHPAPVLA